jgi:hypothetical protein
VLRELGYDERAIEALSSGKVIQEGQPSPAV